MLIDFILIGGWVRNVWGLGFWDWWGSKGDLTELFRVGAKGGALKNGDNGEF